MPADLSALTADLVAESASLEEILAPLTPPQWQLPTPAAGWTIADQVSHLAYFDETTLLSIRDPERFRREAAALGGRGDDFPDQIAAEYRHLDAAELLAWFRTARGALLQGYASVDPGARLPWYGLDMGPASSITARLMETWAHGQAIYDLLGQERSAADRIKNVAVIGINTFGWTFANRGLPVPSTRPSVRLTSPSGVTWEWNQPDQKNVIEGSAVEFCQVVTQTRNIADTKLKVIGETANVWMSIAQCFAGPPENPPLPGTRFRHG